MVAAWNGREWASQKRGRYGAPRRRLCRGGGNEEHYLTNVATTRVVCVCVCMCVCVCACGKGGGIRGANDANDDADEGGDDVFRTRIRVSRSFGCPRSCGGRQCCWRSPTRRIQGLLVCTGTTAAAGDEDADEDGDEDEDEDEDDGGDDDDDDDNEVWSSSSSRQRTRSDKQQ